jgi:ATP-dependent helicase/nuclease subunit A
VGLTPRQLEAVAVEEPSRDTCVVAGPGSGKTTVLVAHFERLVESGVDPLRILAITFTDKAANNVRDRLARTFGDRAEIRGKLERAYVSTVHGFCARVLKENAVFAGLDPEFYVMDERESLREQLAVVNAVLDAMLMEQPDRTQALIRGISANDVGKEILDAYDAIRAAGVTVAGLHNFPVRAPAEIGAALDEARKVRPGWDWKATQVAHLQEAQNALERIAAAMSEGPEAALRAIESFECNLQKLKRGGRAYDLLRDLKQELLPKLERATITAYYAGVRGTILELFTRFDDSYRARKRQLGGLDYDDLEEYTVRLLEGHTDVQRRLQNQFERVLMDEYQDTNGRQSRLLELIRTPDRFYAVGDINQSIYGFRHAEPGVFHGYRDIVERDGKRLVQLVENFRSRPEILRAVETVANGAEGVEDRPLIPGKIFPREAEAPVEVIAAATPEIEAQWVAARILELQGRLQLRDRTAEFMDFALLVRNSEVLEEFTRAFDACGIPYVVNRGKGFYETREVLDLMHLLRVLANPRDQISMAAVLRSPFVQASDEDLMREFLPKEDVEASVDTARMSGCDTFRERLARWRATRAYTAIDQLLLRAIDECGYQPATGARGAANIEKFLAQARDASARQTLSEFVEEIGVLRESKPREPDAPPEDSANAVKVMTVHAAKGLEFPVVFLAAMQKGIDASPGAIAFSPRIGLGVRWHHPCGGDKDDAFLNAIRQELKQREKEEGNRLLYVAMTRAEEHLVMSYSGKKQNWAAIVADRLEARTVDELPVLPAPHAQDQAAVSVQVLQRPTVTGQHDSQANVTSIAMYADCPRRYYLSRYLGFKPAGGAEIQPAAEFQQAGLPADVFGMQVHALLGGTVVESPDPDAAKLADAFRHSQLGRRAAAAAHSEREFDFLMELENMVLRGQIDLWFKERGKTVLVDYKTDRISATGVPARAERYELQLRLYALALERLNGRAPDEGYIYFLRPNTAVPVDLRPSLFGSPEAAVREFREAQERLDFPLREGDHCRTCPHFTRLCPARPELGAPAAPTQA